MHYTHRRHDFIHFIVILIANFHLPTAFEVFMYNVGMQVRTHLIRFTILKQLKFNCYIPYKIHKFLGNYQKLLYDFSCDYCILRVCMYILVVVA